ncbi:stage II sporulation protein M, partial [Xanthomonas citri pv. citri]|nr:stage II sporulation protein M [Xanthomonas citri pv. citri]
NSDEVQKNEVNEYITNFVTTLKSNNSIDKNELINVSLKRNILMGIILWFIGSTIIGLPLIYFFILYKGICIGYTISGAILAL